MSEPHFDLAPPGGPTWDIVFTRLTRAVRPRIETCALELARRFQAIGLDSDRSLRRTPRGLSNFLALVGRRGLVCIVDMTWIDGLALGQGPRAWLDIRLLDACGDVVADGLACGGVGRTSRQTWGVESVVSQNLDRAATVIYVAALGHFDLLRPIARQA